MPTGQRCGAALPGLIIGGDHFPVPECETAMIEMLRTKFGASIELGGGKEFEFLNKARDAGVKRALRHLGHSVQHLTGVSADEMVQEALSAPHETNVKWSQLYDLMVQ